PTLHGSPSCRYPGAPHISANVRRRPWCEGRFRQCRSPRRWKRSPRERREGWHRYRSAVSPTALKQRTGVRRRKGRPEEYGSSELSLAKAASFHSFNLISNDGEMVSTESWYFPVLLSCAVNQKGGGHACQTLVVINNPSVLFCAIPNNQ